MECSHPVLHVPVRGTAGARSLRTFRLADGTRVGVAFTAGADLHRVLGPDHAAVEMTLPALHDLLAPLGVTEVRLDPVLVARPALQGQAAS